MHRFRNYKIIIFISSCKGIASRTCWNNINNIYLLVTVPGGRSPPVICGLNTGQHIFIDSSSACNILAFNLGKIKFKNNLLYQRQNNMETDHSFNYATFSTTRSFEYILQYMSNIRRRISLGLNIIINM